MNKCAVFFFLLFAFSLLGCSFILNMCDLKLGSLNINGAREDVKRASLFNLIRNKKLNLTFL